MIGTGHPTDAFRRPEARSEAARFVKAEFRDPTTAWLMHDAPVRGAKRRAWGFRSLWSWIRVASARFAGLFL